MCGRIQCYVLCDLPHFIRLGVCSQHPLVWKYAWHLLHWDTLFCFRRGSRISTLMFGKYSVRYILLLLAAGSICKKSVQLPCVYCSTDFLYCVPLFQFLPAELRCVLFYCHSVRTLLPGLVCAWGIELVSLLGCILLFCNIPLCGYFYCHCLMFAKCSLIYWLPVQLQLLVAAFL